MRNTSTALTTFEELFRDMNRVAIGFEPTFRIINDVRKNITSTSSGYPPYDLEMVNDDHYKITLAVAGFTNDDLDIQVGDNQLTITGDIKNKESRKYLYNGIATRSFSKVFHLADHVRVENANLENGLLIIDLIREVPEALKPRKIEINKNKVIDAKVS